jgi:hypothetical protein
MTKLEFVNKYLYGYDGQEKVQFDKLVAILEDLATRGCGGDQALAANTVGLAVIGAGTGWVNITVTNDANDIVHLPAVAGLTIGHTVRGVCPTTGCEIRVAVADDATVYLNNDKTTVHEAALAAGASFEAILVAADRWILHNFAAAGTYSAPTPD